MAGSVGGGGVLEVEATAVGERRGGEGGWKGGGEGERGVGGVVAQRAERGSISSCFEDKVSHRYSSAPKLETSL